MWSAGNHAYTRFGKDWLYSVGVMHIDKRSLVRHAHGIFTQYYITFRVRRYTRNFVLLYIWFLASLFYRFYFSSVTSALKIFKKFVEVYFLTSYNHEFL